MLVNTDGRKGMDTIVLLAVSAIIAVLLLGALLAAIQRWVPVSSIPWWAHVAAYLAILVMVLLVVFGG